MNELVKCFMCGGSGTDGHDRCYPPNDYICYICNGTGEITNNRYRLVKFVEDLLYPDRTNRTFTSLEAALQWIEPILAENDWQQPEGEFGRDYKK